MNFKEAINKFPLLKSIYEELVIKTNMGRQMLFYSEFSDNKEYLEKQYEAILVCQRYIKSLTNNDKMLLECILYDIHNITGSIRILQNGDSLDDIGLFEVKAFCLSCKKLKKMLANLDYKDFVFNDLQEVIDLLDPEGIQANQFYIYPAYHPMLSTKRKLFEQYKKESDQRANDVYEEILEIENEVRKTLSQKLLAYCNKIQEDIKRVGFLDICIAKAELNIKFNLTSPTITDKNIVSYTKIFNPILKSILQAKGKDFQAIDISLEELPTLITGANMAGKTVVLKTLALSQLMLQFGFFVPCESCEVGLFKDVLCSIGDNQNENEGLSSFASEILLLNSIIHKVKTKEKYLVLVDELARTTNPTEGVKLLEGFIRTIEKGNSITVVTTHYSNIKAECKRLRVRGFIGKNMQTPISIENLADNMDYSLIEDNSNIAPNEAINLCNLLGIDKDWLSNINN